MQKVISICFPSRAYHIRTRCSPVWRSRLKSRLPSIRIVPQSSSTKLRRRSPRFINPLFKSWTMTRRSQTKSSNTRQSNSSLSKKGKWLSLREARTQAHKSTIRRQSSIPMSTTTSSFPKAIMPIISHSYTQLCLTLASLHHKQHNTGICIHIPQLVPLLWAITLSISITLNVQARWCTTISSSHRSIPCKADHSHLKSCRAKGKRSLNLR